MREDIQNLMARYDGESIGDEPADSADRLAGDAHAQEIMTKFAEADRAFKDAADELLDLPVPESLIAAIRQPQPGASSTQAPAGQHSRAHQASSHELPDSESPNKDGQSGASVTPDRSAQIIAFPKPRAIVGLALAASVAAIVATNVQFFETSVGGPSPAQAPAYASLLQNAMETVPSGDLAASEDGSFSVTPVLSFQTAENDYCREFMALKQGEEFSGFACRDKQGSWQIRNEQRLASQPESSAYRAAEGDAADSPVDAAATLKNSRELSYAEEQAVIRDSWATSGRKLADQ